MSRNSKKAWHLIRKLNNNPAIPKHQYYPVTANQVAHQLLVNGQTKGKKAPRVKFRKNGKQNMESNLTSPFTAQEFSNGIAALKNGIFTEELNTSASKLKNGCLKCLIDARKPITFPRSGGNHTLLLSQNQANTYHCLKGSDRSPYYVTHINCSKGCCLEGLLQL